MKTDQYTRFARIIGIFGVILVAACSNTGVGGTAADPFEQQNRAVHAFNKAADKNVIRPASQAYAAVIPSPVRKGLSNGVTNLNQPVYFVNHVLQGDVDDAARTFFRFAVNTLFGFGGLLDPASDGGLFEESTDFGETLAVWGVREGAYIELPIAGPSSERDLAGKVVDLALNPTRYVIPTPESYYLLGGQALNLLHQRHEYAGIIDGLLYESADSYAQARIAYLQNKANAVGNGPTEESLEDPYADF